MKKVTLAQYCKNSGITLQSISTVSGISYSFLASIKHDENPSLKMGIDKAIGVWKATRKIKGEGQGLAIQDWLDVPPIWER